MAQEPSLLDVPSTAQSADDVNLPSEARERKRVLNILAQRRYRRRRRERHAELEQLMSRSGSSSNTTPTSDAQHSNEQYRQIGSSASEFTPDGDNRELLSELTWPNPGADIWVPNLFDISPDLSTNTSSDTVDETMILLNDFLQTDDIVSTTFADDFEIVVPELDLLRAAYEISGRLRSATLLFDMNANSIFLTSDCSGWITKLPKNLQPTSSQLVVPHHPIIDILPWPAVRNKLIHMYNMPSDMWPRHPEDGTESSLVRLVYDMEDGGVRVTGSDPANESSWEIEQRFFQAWWWAMDKSVVSISNNKRVARGDSKLYSR